MTDRQAQALANPINPDGLNALIQFAATIRRGEQAYLTILSIDRQDGFWWHAGVSVLSSNLKPVPLSGLFDGERKGAERMARTLLEDVGRPDSEELHWDQKCLHLIRRLTIEEERQVGSLAAKNSPVARHAKP